MLIAANAGGLYAQEPWTAQRCVNYAVSHNHDVQISQISANDYQIQRSMAIGQMLPTVGAGTNARCNYGRAVDPETNTYTNVNTLGNYYWISASLPLFAGLQNYNELRASKANMLMGRQGVLAQKDAVAQNVLKCYIDALYYQGALELATQKLDESRMLLQSTSVMCEVGTKSEADLAQIQAQVAGDDFELARQRGLLSNSMLKLRQIMNLPAGDSIALVPIANMEAAGVDSVSASQVFDISCKTNPQIMEAELGLQAAQYSYKSSKGALAPRLSVGAEISSSYYKKMGEGSPVDFGTQIDNNLGQCVYAELQIPIFNRTHTLNKIRQQRNNVNLAQEKLDKQKADLMMLVQETITDCGNSYLEAEKMRLKARADSIASQITIRKYEQGLASAIDVQTATVTAVNSRAQLLLCQLNYYYKTTILNYYKGEALWTE